VYVIIDVSKQRIVYIKHYAISKRPLQFTAGIHEDYPMGRQRKKKVKGEANNETQKEAQ
jgi:hypothetical protein